ncbi:hypothetical protein [Flavobacterium sp. HJJ]|uniref:hypothetical protein n=1 Tax=Flavobacterium sp. HJJ TaxID=2783792 RepID=UPI00188AB1A5|nr:hypothetical protein [Flavobacterium sp. HJJ]MBF4472790.1 hypothetical protein [Flavobacterium sp. HJJ]
MNYSNEFEEAVDFSKKNKLFLGYGNPNGKILMIGKEHYFNHSLKEDSSEFYEEILKARELENQNNIASWESNLKNNFEPEWNPNQEFHCDNSNAYTAWWNQKNIQHKNYNGGTSNTYLHYQKLYQNIFLNRQKGDRINFQKEFFNTELNDLPAKKDFNLLLLNKLKNEFIEKRKELFNLPFFKTFPIVIVASGHYPSKYNFDIEKIFEVTWDKNTIVISKSWYNLHYSEDNKRLLIHTRQLSTSVSTDLMEALSKEVSVFLSKNGFKLT